MNILAIETSCDETAAAVIKDGTEIVSNVVASSTKFHAKYGGVLPELAARKQLEFILPVISTALKPFSSTTTTNYQLLTSNHIDALAVTIGPGLIGSLLIGVETAKTLAFVTGKPIIPVNHVLAHMYANFLNAPLPPLNLRGGEGELSENKITFPAISLVVSGGHTELFLMKNIKDLTWLGGTLDDAAGECFDKTARLLGFGNRGGVAIQEAANLISPGGVTLPRPMIHDKSLNFSFSGLKTAVLREVNKLKSNNGFNDVTIQQLSHEIQEAITDVLVSKTLKAAQMYEAKSILLSGGVASNLRLREKFTATIQQCNNATMNFRVPPPKLCTDNAAYIGSYAFFRGIPQDWHTITVAPNLSVEN